MEEREARNMFQLMQFVAQVVCVVIMVPMPIMFVMMRMFGVLFPRRR